MNGAIRNERTDHAKASRRLYRLSAIVGSGIRLPEGSKGYRNSKTFNMFHNTVWYSGSAFLGTLCGARLLAFLEHALIGAFFITIDQT